MSGSDSSGGSSGGGTTTGGLVGLDGGDGGDPLATANWKIDGVKHTGKPICSVSGASAYSGQVSLQGAVFFDLVNVTPGRDAGALSLLDHCTAANSNCAQVSWVADEDAGCSYFPGTCPIAGGCPVDCMSNSSTFEILLEGQSGSGRPIVSGIFSLLSENSSAESCASYCGPDGGTGIHLASGNFTCQW